MNDFRQTVKLILVEFDGEIGVFEIAFANLANVNEINANLMKILISREYLCILYSILGIKPNLDEEIGFIEL